MSDRDWMVFDLAAEIEKLQASGSPYAEFLRVPNLSCGVYKLPAGANDMQGPHDEDEVYYVLKGKAKMQADGRKEALVPGSFVFVAAGEEHRFVDIEEDLELLVFFSSGAPQKKPVKKENPKKNGK